LNPECLSILTEKQIVIAIDRQIAWKYSTPYTLNNLLIHYRTRPLLIMEQITAAFCQIAVGNFETSLLALLQEHSEPITTAARKHPDKMMQCLEEMMQCCLEKPFSTLNIELFQWIVKVLPRPSRMSFWKKYSGNLNAEQLGILDESCSVPSLVELCCAFLQRSDVPQEKRETFMAWAQRDCYPFQSFVQI
jgi:hypothetical protein